ncbi:MAG: Gfo/Idh/MocA family protein [Candidatus Omnitrophota bacterium]
MRKIKFGIVGCGRIAYRHIEAIQENENAELVALCDLNLERAAERNRNINVKIYQNYNTMLLGEEIDAVCIMTPSGMHPEHAIDIIEKYKKHIVLEKPMALRVEDGQRLIQTAKKYGVNLFVVHQNRFNKAVTKIKSAVDNKILGKIVMGTVRLRWSRGQAYYDRDPWRGTWALDGGALTNQTIHHIDLLQWLCGEVESVSAVAKTQLVNVEVEDSAVAWLKFKNGALGTIEATTAARPLNKDIEASISILGDKGTVIVEGASVNKLTTWTVNDEDISAFQEDPPNVYGFGHNTIINNVVDVLNGRAEPLVPGDEALQSIRLLNAIYRSIELQGQEVKLADNPVSERFGVIDQKAPAIADLYRTDVVLGSLQK